MTTLKEENTQSNSAYTIIILGLIAGILTIPIFIFLYKYFPSIAINLSENPIRLDHIILFLVLFFVIFYLLKKLRVLILIIVFTGAIVLSIGYKLAIEWLENDKGGESNNEVTPKTNS